MENNILADNLINNTPFTTTLREISELPYTEFTLSELPPNKLINQFVFP